MYTCDVAKSSQETAHAQDGGAFSSENISANSKYRTSNRHTLNLIVKRFATYRIRIKGMTEDKCTPIIDKLINNR